jgi:radical SAM superfamily enzyme
MFDFPEGKRYNTFVGYYRRRYGERLQKLVLDAGFTCPNRDGTLSLGGCTYCDNAAFHPGYSTPGKSLRGQIDEGIGFHRVRYPRAKNYLAYFQAYSNTYAPLERLKVLYEEALSHPSVVGVVIGTRPDCIDEAKLDYLADLASGKVLKGWERHLAASTAASAIIASASTASPAASAAAPTASQAAATAAAPAASQAPVTPVASCASASSLYQPRTSVLTAPVVVMEYGIESCFDSTLARINRGHDFETARKAVEMTAARGIDVCAHFILGLPGETRQMLLDQCDAISSMPLRSVKFHQLQIVKGTRMEKEYSASPSDFLRLGLDDYIDLVVDILERLRPDLSIERVAGEVPPRFVTETPWGLVRNLDILRLLDARLEARGTWQGRLYRP